MKSEWMSNAASTSAADTGADDGADFTISEIFRTLYSYKNFILLSVALGGAIAALIAYTRTPIYEASATLRIDPQRANSLGLAGLTGNIGGGGDELDTDIGIIKSETVAIYALNQLSDSEYRKFAGVSKSVGQVAYDAVNLSPMQQGIVSSLRGNLDAKQVGATQIISVTYRSSDPQLAAGIANDVVSAFVKESFASRYSSVQQIQGFLGDQMEKLRDEASQSQRKLTEFQEKNHILETSSGTGASGQSSNITLDTLRQMNNALTEARANRLLKEAQMKAAHEANPEVLATLFVSPTVTALLAQRAALNVKLSELSSRFDVRYPPLVELRQEIAANNQRVDAAIADLRRRADSDYNTATTSEQLLQNEYDKQVQLAYAQNRQEAEYAVLGAETRSASVLYDALQSKLQQAGLDAGLNAINILPIDHARVPLVPVEPKKTLIIGVGVFVGLLLGISIVLLREIISDAVVNGNQVEERFGLHVLSLVPHLTAVKSTDEIAANPDGTKTTDSMLVAHYAAGSRAAESFRSLRNGLLLSQQGLKTVLVSSVHPAEGKSITSVNLAIVMAQKGAKVLLVDADLRRPTVHMKFQLPNAHGLSDLILSEEKDFKSFVRTPIADLPELHLITAGGRTRLPSEMLSSKDMRSLMEQWEREYDYVVIDSAPLLVVSDSLQLARWADAVVLVVRAGKTSLRGLRRVRAVLAQAQTSITGIVLNDVPENSQAYGGYGYTYYSNYYE